MKIEHPYLEKKKSKGNIKYQFLSMYQSNLRIYVWFQKRQFTKERCRLEKTVPRSYEYTVKLANILPKNKRRNKEQRKKKRNLMTNMLVLNLNVWTLLTYKSLSFYSKLLSIVRSRVLRLIDPVSNRITYNLF